jgi:hypothetical protein
VQASRNHTYFQPTHMFVLFLPFSLPSCFLLSRSPCRGSHLIGIASHTSFIHKECKAEEAEEATMGHGGDGRGVAAGVNNNNNSDDPRHRAATTTVLEPVRYGDHAPDGDNEPRRTVVFAFCGEGAHHEDVDVSLLQQSPLWSRCEEAVAQTRLSNSASLGEFLRANLGEHHAPSSPVVTTVVNILLADIWQGPSIHILRKP